jgi:excisionase family DNA binding protein
VSRSVDVAGSSPVELKGSQLLTTQDVMARLVVSESTVGRLARSGELPPIRIGSLVRFSPDDLTAFIGRQRTKNESAC